MKDFLRQFKGKEHGHLVQFIKYGIAGGIATVVHTVLFFLLTWKVFPALTADDPIARLFNIPASLISDGIRAWHAGIANAIAFLFSNFVVYLINVAWVFESGRHSRIKEIGMFYAVAAISVLIGIGLQSFLISGYGIPTTYAFGAMIVVCLMINYLMRKFFIFKG
ncbi:MAG: GtrA family protein [PVC group bacterium]